MVHTLDVPASKTMGPIHRIMLQLVGNSIVNLGLLTVIAIRLENINPVHMDQLARQSTVFSDDQ